MNRAALATACVVPALLGLSCGQEPTLPPGLLAPVTIGVISSLTGDLGSLGSGWADAAALAVHEVNAAGGVLPGRAVDMRLEDDQTNPDVAAAAAQSLIDEGAVGIIGAPSSAASLRVAELTANAGIPQISGTSTSDLLNNGGAPGVDSHPFFYRTVPSDSYQGWVVAGAMAGQIDLGEWSLDCSFPAVIHLDNDYGRPLGQAVAARLSELGRAPLKTVAVQAARPSYAEAVRSVSDAEPDCIALVAYPESGGTIVREWSDLGGGPVRWIGTDGIRSGDFVDGAGDGARGVLGTAPFTTPDTLQHAAFQRAYRSTFGQDPGAYEFSSAVYDATALLLLAIASASATDGQMLRDRLLRVARPDGSESYFGPGELVSAMAEIRAGRDVDYHGAAGPCDFFANGDVLTDYQVWRWDGDFVPVATVRSSEISAP